jgi:hypothetical protein
VWIKVLIVLKLESVGAVTAGGESRYGEALRKFGSGTRKA